MLDAHLKPVIGLIDDKCSERCFRSVPLYLLLEHAEGHPTGVLYMIKASRASCGLLWPVLPYWIVLVNSQPSTKVLETRDELAAPPGVVLFMQQVQHDEPSPFPQPFPSPAGTRLDSNNPPHKCNHCRPF